MAKKIPVRVGRKLTPTGSATFKERMGARIRELRESKGYTLEEASLMTFGLVSPSLWSFYERHTEPGAEKLIAIALALQVRVEALLPEDVLALFDLPVLTEKRVKSAFGIRENDSAGS